MYSIFYKLHPIPPPPNKKQVVAPKSLHVLSLSLVLSIVLVPSSPTPQKASCPPHKSTRSLPLPCLIYCTCLISCNFLSQKSTRSLPLPCPVSCNFLSSCFSPSFTAEPLKVLYPYHHLISPPQ